MIYHINIGVCAIAILFLPMVVNAGETTRPAQTIAFNCFTCHGTDGQSTGEIPSINGTSQRDLRTKLIEFKNDEGKPTIMNRIIKGYSDDEIDRVSEYLSTLD